MAITPMTQGSRADAVMDRLRQSATRQVSLTISPTECCDLLTYVMDLNSILLALKNQADQQLRVIAEHEQQLESLCSTIDDMVAEVRRAASN